MVKDSKNGKHYSKTFAVEVLLLQKYLADHMGILVAENNMNHFQVLKS